MISTAHRFIFLHIPKTGGNAIQSALLPLSDDAMSGGAGTDGVNRFNISGPVTPRKHATMQDYADVFGEARSRFRSIIVLRDPLQRALSLYYSPRRLLRGATTLKKFDMTVFAALLRKMETAIDFISVDGVPAMPDHVIRFTSLSADFARVSEALSLPALKLQKLNTSGDTMGLRAALASDPDVIAMVRQKFAADYAFFGSML